jgi:radical SAM protein with 4Fe4S-binding SPASM domain
VIVRFEPWGAWVKLETQPAIVALDRDGVRALGLDGGRAWEAPGGPSTPIEVHMAVTARCGAGCRGCYLDVRPDGEEPPIAHLERELDAAAAAGVFTVAFGGGEPTTRDDLDVLADAARARGLTPVVTTSGIGLTEERLRRLTRFEQVNVSYDGRGDAYAQVRGFDASDAAERAIERLTRAGVRVGINVVLTRDTFSALAATIRRARELGAVEAQLLRYKPAGRAATLDYLARRLTPAQARELGPTIRELARTECADGSFHVRIDCALVPFLSADPELSSRSGELTRLGVFGCEAAGALAAFTIEGRVAPCSFAATTELAATDLGALGADRDVEAWRSYVASPPEPCASCALRPVCKGGCKVVARFLDGAHGPDPECPRVLDHRRKGLA